MQYDISETTHDRLQAQCWQWTWNYFQQTRPLCFGVMNEVKRLKGEDVKAHMIRIQQMKAIGLVPGVWDFMFFWKGVLYIFDIKVGKDKLSDAQKAFKDAVMAQGGAAYEIENFYDFKKIFSNIISNGKS